jgi:hypothetical protein
MDELKKSHYFLVPIDPEQKSRFSKIIKEFPDKESVFQPENSESDWVVKFNINGGSEFYISIAWEKSSKAKKNYKTFVNRLYAIRDILAFRYDMIRRLDHDFTSTAFLQYLSQKEFSSKLSDIKTATHTPESERLQVCNDISRLCYEKNDNTITQTEKLLAAMNLKLAADSLISELAYKRLNAEFISLENRVKTEITNEELFHTRVNFNDKLVNILNEITCKRSEDPSGNFRTKVKIKISEKSLRVANSFMLKSESHYLLLFIGVICQNAVKHGIVEKDDVSGSNVVIVEIFIDDKRIHFKNSFSKPNNELDTDSFSSLNEIKNYYSSNFADQKLIMQPATFEYGDDTKSNYIVKLPLINIGR